MLANHLWHSGLRVVPFRAAKRAVSQCRTACFVVPSGLFRAAKRLRGRRGAPVVKMLYRSGLRPGCAAGCRLGGCKIMQFRSNGKMWRLVFYSVPMFVTIGAQVHYTLFIYLPHGCYSLPKVSCRGRRRADTLSARRLLARFWQSQGWLRSPRRPAASKRNNN